MPTKASVVVAVTVGNRRYLRTVAVMVENPEQIIRAIDQSRDKVMVDLAKVTAPKGGPPKGEPPKGAPSAAEKQPDQP